MIDQIINSWFIRSLLIPAVDVLLLAFVIYKGYQILVQTQAVSLAKGALVLALLYAAAFVLNLSTFLWIINTLAPSLFVAVVVIFQPELRRVFTRIGQGSLLNISRPKRQVNIDAALNAAEVLSFRRRGALIVFQRRVGLKDVVDKGRRIDAELDSSLIISIFGHDTPLHDGAIVVVGGRLDAAACVLPLSEQRNVRRSFGTRHRAALGMAEITDAVVLVVSEESGAISLAYDSVLQYDLGVAEARRQLRRLLDVPTSAGRSETGSRAD